MEIVSDLKSMSISPGDIILFFDKRLPADPKERGDQPSLNRVGVIINEAYALSINQLLGTRYIERMPVAKLQELANLTLRRCDPPEFGNAIAAFFRNHRRKVAQFDAGLRSLFYGNMQPFAEGRVYPTRPSYPNDASYQASWRYLISQLQPMDMLFTIDRSSLLSRFIAWSTHGPWSHVALYVGEGEISESTTSGLRTCSIEVYHSRRYWIGAYRRIEAFADPKPLEEARSAVVASCRQFKPNRYNYAAAIWHGARAFLGRYEDNLVPNCQMLHGQFVRIAQA